MDLEKSDNPLTWEAASLAKKTLTMHYYGEFNGFRKPNIGELLLLRGAIDAAIYELKTENVI